MLHFFEDLLIHGEGGDGAGAAPGAAPAAEAAGVTAPDAGERQKRLTKEERRARLEEKLKAEQAGQQPQNAQPQQKAAPPISWEEAEKLFPDQIGERIKQAVTGRVKNLKDSSEENAALKAELEEAKALLARAAQRQYGIEPGADGKIDIAAIKQADSRSRAEDYALANGVSEEFAEQRLQMEDRLAEQDRQLREYKAAEEARQQDAERYAQFQKHREQAEAFRQKIPGFDLLKEMEGNKLFTHLLNCGVPVENAYYAAHHDELMAAGQQAAAISTQRAVAASIQAGQTMPTEGGLGRSPAASPQRVTNPRQWTKAQRADVRRRVQRGEEIYL